LLYKIKYKPHEEVWLSFEIYFDMLKDWGSSDSQWLAVSWTSGV